MSNNNFRLNYTPPNWMLALLSSRMPQSVKEHCVSGKGQQMKETQHVTFDNPIVAHCLQRSEHCKLMLLYIYYVHKV